MPTYVTLFKWTEQGVKSAAESPDRVDQSRELFSDLGITITSIYWTQGKYDLVGIVDAPDDETLAAGLLRLAKAGNVRTTTMRAFGPEEFRRLSGRI